MLDFFRSAKHTAVRTGLLIWHNLFKVLALFTLTMSIFLLGNYYWIALSPTDNYLKYNDLSVADVIQGERAVATVCYEVNERHQAEGEAVFYVENQKGDRVYDSKVEFDFTLSGGTPCEQEYIPTQKLEPGVYYLHLIRTIRVQTLVPFTDPIEKKADVAASDTFTVTEKSFSKTEMKATIKDINERIAELNKKLVILRKEPATPIQSGVTTKRAEPQTSGGTPEPIVAARRDNSRPTPAPRPSNPVPTPARPANPSSEAPAQPQQKGLTRSITDPVLNLLLGGN